jgi:hypothetical protein
VEEPCQGLRKHVVVLDEMAQEASHDAHRLWAWPITAYTVAASMATSSTEITWPK